MLDGISSSKRPFAACLTAGVLGALSIAYGQQASSTPAETPGTVPPPTQTPGVTPEPDSLFVPVVPGATPKPTPAPEKKEFVPSDIPAPAIQATPETTDEVDTGMTGAATTSLQPAMTLRPAPTPMPQTTLPPATAMPAATPAMTLPTLEQESTSAPTRTYTRTTGEQTTTRTRTYTRHASSEVSEAISGEKLEQMMTQARATQSAKLATAVGWAEFNRKDYESAGMWFEQAISWNTELGEAYYGLALTRFTQGDTSQAEAIAGYRANSYPKMRTLFGDILVRRAMEDYQARRYTSAIDALNKASHYRTLSRNELIIEGWSYYYAGDYRSSANIFESLYRKRPDQPSAEGLYAVLSRTKDWARLQRICGQVPGPLNHIYMTYDTEQYYKSGLYVAAYSSNEKAYPELQNIDSPSAAVGLEYGYKSGTSGEGQLVTERLPVGQIKFYPANQVEISAEVARLVLRSGTPSEGAQIGTPPEEFQPFSQNITTSYNNLYEMKGRISYQDWFSPYLEIGSTPINGPINASVTGKAGAQYRYSSGYVQGEFYSQSNRESMLSYIGMQDPYVAGRTWGRVQETGGSLQVFQGFLQDYTAYGKVSYGELTGVNVENNYHLSLIGSISRVFKLEGFEYVSVGPAVSYDQFNNNQNFFTYGNGGYFSPQYIIQGILQAQALTKEGQNWLLYGSIGAGAQQNQQDAAPLFPLDPDGRMYSGSTASTGIFLATAEGGVLLGSQVMVGGKLSYAKTADYNEGFASIYIKYFFEPRAGLFRSDLDMSYW